jgi:hypothetical protein
MNLTWREPITDRKLLDIGGRTKKAFLNEEDLNRIEGNAAYLAQWLNALGYRIEADSKTDWTMEEVPTVGDIRRICVNIDAIARGYFAPEGYRDPSKIAERPLDFQDVNRLENYLKEVRDMMDAGSSFNCHEQLRRHTHKELGERSHEQIRKGIPEQ